MVNCKNTVLGILAKILQKDLSEINALGSNTSLTEVETVALLEGKKRG